MAELVGKRILLLEDEFLVAEMASDMLQELGAKVVGPALRLADGLAMARSEALDAALLDVNIAGERSEPVAAALAERCIPFVFATGYGRQGLATTGRPVLDKPYTRPQLERSLTMLLNGGGKG